MRQKTRTKIFKKPVNFIDIDILLTRVKFKAELFINVLKTNIKFHINELSPNELKCFPSNMIFGDSIMNSFKTNIHFI